MNASPDLLQAVVDFEAELARSVELPEGARKEMVAVRRAISAHMATIALHLQERSAESVISEQLRSEFSKVRHAMALHQATWPVVSIDFKNPNHLTSLRRTRDANQRFINLIRTSFGAAKLKAVNSQAPEATASLNRDVSYAARASPAIDG